MITSYARQYEQTQVTTSSGVQLIVLLYDGAIQSMEIARQEIQVKNIQGKARHLGRAIAIVGELNSVLDLEQGGEIARSLRRLYDYVMMELLASNSLVWLEPDEYASERTPSRDRAIDQGGK